MVITDGIHMTSTSSETELHEFALGIGMKRAWYQNHPVHPHYDLMTEGRLTAAICAGARLTHPYDLVKLQFKRSGGVESPVFENDYSMAAALTFRARVKDFAKAKRNGRKPATTPQESAE